MADENDVEETEFHIIEWKNREMVLCPHIETEGFTSWKAKAQKVRDYGFDGLEDEFMEIEVVPGVWLYLCNVCATNVTGHVVRRLASGVMR